MENRKGQQILPPLTITHVFYQVFLGEIQGKTAALKKKGSDTVMREKIKAKIQHDVIYSRKQLHK